MGSSEMGLIKMKELRQRNQIDDGFERPIRPTGPWVEDWIWASPTIALSVLRLGLGVSGEIE